MKKYYDRSEAGKILSEDLQNYSHKSDVIVLALPRGGVPVAYEIAKSLAVPLDVFIVRKLGVPWHEELAMGAIASGDTLIFNDEIIRDMNVTQSEIERVIQSEQIELNRREITYRGDKPFPELANKTIILVDDGIATGATIRAAIKGIRKHNPAKIIVAVPVAARETYEAIKKIVDEMICPQIPISFHAVGLWYEHFPQTSDEEVFELLSKTDLFYR